jgi:hypothetical protein
LRSSENDEKTSCVLLVGVKNWNKIISSWRILEDFESRLEKSDFLVKSDENSRIGLKKGVKIWRVKWACAQKHLFPGGHFEENRKKWGFWRPFLRGSQEEGSGRSQGPEKVLEMPMEINFCCFCENRE